MHIGPLSSTLLLLSSFLIAKASYFPEKLGLEQMCESVVKEVNSMDVEDLLEQGNNSLDRFSLLYVLF